ncbi:MAG: lipid A deacylase LpxR family protein [Rhodobacteraceae bacterium]|nr:lipid A deacylase LpxR family protein [Paracoccaceae bacterium]
MRDRFMLRHTLATLVLTLSIQTTANAETATPQVSASEPPSHFAHQPIARLLNRKPLGYGRLVTNDLFGDGQDRWRTGSVTVSRAYGYKAWTGKAPSQLGQLLETRVQGQIIAPENMRDVNLADRPYAGSLSFGLHTHAANRGFEYALGADLVIIGPQTHLDDLQTGLHKLFNVPAPSKEVLALQIGNKVRPTAVGEIGRKFRLGESVEFRPFGELRAGDETLVRVGADILIGSVGRGELFARESVSGQRYRVIYQSGPGYSVTIGADIAYVSDSVYLPKDRGYTLSSHRDRVRLGINWQGKNASAFYGLTYLGKEFDAQPEGQVIGSVRIKLRF